MPSETPLSHSSCPGRSASPAAFPLLRLPVEIIVEVFKQSDYFTLRVLRLVCKVFNKILSKPAFMASAFLPVRKPVIQSEKDRKALLPKLPKRKLLDEDGNEYEETADCSPYLRMHPVLSQANWTLPSSNWREVELSAPGSKMRLPRLGGTKLSKEYATDPPIDDFEVLVVGPRNECYSLPTTSDRVDNPGPITVALFYHYCLLAVRFLEHAYQGEDPPTRMIGTAGLRGPAPTLEIDDWGTAYFRVHFDRQI